LFYSIPILHLILQFLSIKIRPSSWGWRFKKYSASNFWPTFIDQVLIRIAEHIPPMILIFQMTSTWLNAASRFKARA